jgi:hypothetical protein
VTCVRDWPVSHEQDHPLFYLAKRKGIRRSRTHRESEGLAKGLAQRKFLSRGLLAAHAVSSSSETGYKNGWILPTSDPLLAAPKPMPVHPDYACLALPMGHGTLASTRSKEILILCVFRSSMDGVCR